MGPGQFGVFIPILGLLIGGFVVFAKSEIGRALAHRIRGGEQTASGVDAELQALHGEIEALRSDLMETQERLDFTERMLASGRKES